MFCASRLSFKEAWSSGQKAGTRGLRVVGRAGRQGTGVTWLLHGRKPGPVALSWALAHPGTSPWSGLGIWPIRWRSSRPVAFLVLLVPFISAISAAAAAAAVAAAAAAAAAAAGEIRCV
jgi:hypothetical protein